MSIVKKKNLRQITVKAMANIQIIMHNKLLRKSLLRSRLKKKLRRKISPNKRRTNRRLSDKIKTNRSKRNEIDLFLNRIKYTSGRIQMMDYSLGPQSARNNSFAASENRNLQKHDTLSMTSNYTGMVNHKLNNIELGCRTHAEEICCNYCVEPKCFQPLCAECIEEHLLLHKKAGLTDLSIKSMRGVRKECVFKLSKMIEELIQRLNLLQQPKNPEEILEEMENKLDHIKHQMHELIEQQFANLKETVKSKVNESFVIIKGLEEIHCTLEDVINKLRDTASIIGEGKSTNSNVSVSESIQKTITLNENSLLESFQKQSLNYTSKLKKIDFDLLYHPDIFKAGLLESLKVSSNNLKSLDTSSVSFKLPNQKSRVKSNHDTSYVAGTFPEACQNQSRNKILHFFENGSNLLHLISFNRKKKNLVPERKTIKINEFVVPAYHASLLSQFNDCIYLSGGTIELNGSKKSPLLMRYSLKTNSLKKQFARVRPRSSHSLCEDPFGEHLFILGGYGESSFSNNDDVSGQTLFETAVERVNIKSGSVQFETTSNWGGANISVFCKSFLLKACNEGIEVYNFKIKQWTIAEVKLNGLSSYHFNMSPGYSSIVENGFMVYGGYKSEDQASDQCFFWKIDDTKAKTAIKVEITKLQSLLPIPEGFYSNPAITDKNAIFAIQNIDDGENGGCLQNQKRILKFQFQSPEGEWSIIDEDES